MAAYVWRIPPLGGGGGWGGTRGGWIIYTVNMAISDVLVMKHLLSLTTFLSKKNIIFVCLRAWRQPLQRDPSKGRRLELQKNRMAMAGRFCSNHVERYQISFANWYPECTQMLHVTGMFYLHFPLNKAIICLIWANWYPNAPWDGNIYLLVPLLSTTISGDLGWGRYNFPGDISCLLMQE